jgi:hypothetical protein
MGMFFYLFLILIIVSGITVSSAEKANIILSKTIDVPDRTITFENQTFDITDIGNYRTDEDIRFTIEAEKADDLLVILYDTEQLSIWFKRFTNTSGHIVAVIPSNRTDKTGTYAITVSKNRQIIGAIPLVVSDYDILLNTDSKKVMAGKTLRVDIDVNRNGTPVNVNDTIKVVLARGSSSIETNATRKNTGTYEASIEIPKPMNGTYSLYSVIATNYKVFNNYPEILGIKSGGYIEILPLSEEKKVPAVSNISVVLILLVTAICLRRKS